MLSMLHRTHAPTEAHEPLSCHRLHSAGAWRVCTDLLPSSLVPSSKHSCDLSISSPCPVASSPLRWALERRERARRELTEEPSAIDLGALLRLNAAPVSPIVFWSDTPGVLKRVSRIGVSRPSPSISLAVMLMSREARPTASCKRIRVAAMP